MANVPPSYNASDENDLIGSFNVFRDFILRNLEKCLPAVVISSDRKTATVQPVINVVDTEDNEIERPQAQTIPVFNLGGGGFFINFDIQPGDFGFVLTFDRDASLFFQNMNKSKPNTSRLHSFSDSIFIPQIWFNYTASGNDGAMIISNRDGSVKISLSDALIKLEGPRIDLNSTGPINITATTALTINAATINATADNITLTANNAGILAGNWNVTGNLGVAGALSQASVDVGSGHGHVAGGLTDSQSGAVTGNTGAVS